MTGFHLVGLSAASTSTRGVVRQRLDIRARSGTQRGRLLRSLCLRQARTASRLPPDALRDLVTCSAILVVVGIVCPSSTTSARSENCVAVGCGVGVDPDHEPDGQTPGKTSGPRDRCRRCQPAQRQPPRTLADTSVHDELVLLRGLHRAGSKSSGCVASRPTCAAPASRLGS